MFVLQFVNPDLPGYVGFANLPNQVHRKSVKKGFEFTLLVIGMYIFLPTMLHMIHPNIFANKKDLRIQLHICVLYALDMFVSMSVVNTDCGMWVPASTIVSLNGKKLIYLQYIHNI